MAERRLLVWGLGTFHAVSLVLLLLVLVYSAGGLGSALQGLSTALGFLLFGALWGTSWFCTGRAARRVASVDLTRGGGVVRTGGAADSMAASRRPWVAGPVWVLAQGLLWGGVNGVLFLLCLVSVAAVSLAASSPGRFGGTSGTGVELGAVFYGFAFAFGLGGVVAFIVGALAGLVFALVDCLLLALASLAVAAGSPGSPVPVPPRSGG